jgi:hypothetical protein
MPENQWKKVVAQKAAEIVGPTVLDAAALELLKPDMRPEAFIRVLGEAGRWPDAAKVMARALPAREAVWWACVCARQMKSLTAKEELAGIEAAEKWVYQPTEGNRENAFRMVQGSDAESIGILAASAAAFSGGYLPLEEGHRVDLEPAVFAQVIDAIIMVSAVENNGQEIHRQLQHFLLSGEDIARGGNGLIEQVEGGD